MSAKMLESVVIQEHDVFTDEQVELIHEEIRAIKFHVKPFYFGKNRIHRIDLDALFKSNRNASPMLQYAYSVIYGEKITEKIKNTLDLAYNKMIGRHQYSTVYSEYRESQEYSWHVDAERDSNVFMSFIIYLNNDFEGGELVIKFDKEELIVKPEVNKLVLMPAYLMHKINPIKYNDKSNYRTTINGFLHT